MNWIKPICLSLYKKARSAKNRSYAAPFEISALEPKLLLSAELLGGAVDAASFGLDHNQDLVDTDDGLSEWLQQVVEPIDSLGIGASAAANDSVTASLPDDQVMNGLAQFFAQQQKDSQHDQDMGQLLADAALAASHANDQPLELIIIDPRTPDYLELVKGVSTNTGSDYLVYMLDAQQDGVQQVSDLLGQHQDLNAVHLISHGSNEGIQLGTTWLDNASISEHQDQISDWSAVFDDDADILIYGCDLAGTAAGEQLVQSLAQLTGADVAASTDVTGAAGKGGDWDLEYQVGSIETNIAFSQQTQASWQGTLATFTVDTFDDTIDINLGDGLAIDAAGNTSLRAAIMEANALAGDDIIELSAGTYTLDIAGIDEGASATGDLDIASGILIQGEGSNNTIIDGGGIDRVFQLVNRGELTLNNLAVQGGLVAGAGGGIELSHAQATLSLNQVKVSNNQAVSGSGIYARGAITFTDVELSDNISTNLGSGKGGGLYSWDTANLTNVTVSGNSAGTGGGIYNSGTLNLTNVTVSGNSAAASEGGGIYNDFNSTLTNVTVSNNTAQTQGGGIFNTFIFNISNTIVANNTSIGGSGHDVMGTFTSDGSNLIEDVTGNASFGSDITGTDPALGALTDNGGFTQTHAITTGSAAYNSGTNSGAPAEDQRGIARDDATADIGAYEYKANNAPTATNLSQTIAYTEGAGSVALDDIVVSDADAGDTVTATLTLTDSTAGSLSTGTFGSSTSSYVSGSGVWSVTGTVTDVNAALAAVAFVPAADNAVSVTITTHIEDAQAASPADGTITLNKNELRDGLWFSTNGTATYDGGAVGGESDIVSFGGSGVSLELGDGTVGTTDGDFTTQYTLPENIRALHYVNSDVTVYTMVGGVQGTYDLKEGQIVLSMRAADKGDITVLTVGSGTIDVNNTDLLVYTPSTGEYEFLLEDAILKPNLEIANFHAVSIVEQDTTIGVDTNLTAGTYIFARSGPSGHADIQTYYSDTLGQQDLLLGADFLSDAAEQIQGVEFIESETTIGGQTLTQGSLLISVTTNNANPNNGAVDDPIIVGTTGETIASANQIDVISLTINATQQDTAVQDTNVDAQILFDGSDVAFAVDDGGDPGEINGLTIKGASNTAPNATNLSQTLAYTQGAPSVALDDIVVTDVDSGETVTATLTLADTSMGTLSTGTFGASTSTYVAGTGVWSVTGSVSDVNQALASVAFLPSITNVADVTITTHIEDAAGAGPVDGSILVDVIRTSIKGLLLSTSGDVVGASSKGEDNWSDGDVLQLSDPDLALEPGTTDGSFSSLIDLDAFNPDGDGNVSITAMHRVSTDLTLGTGITFDLLAGDLMLSVNQAEVLRSSDASTLSVGSEDIFVFRPDSANDYSSGKFYQVLTNLTDAGGVVTGLSLVEQDTVVGDANLREGNLIVSVQVGGKDSNAIYYFDIAQAGAVSTGSLAKIIDGSDIGISDGFSGLDLVENQVTLGGVDVAAGSILFSVDNAGVVGDNAAAVSAQDVSLLDVNFISRYNPDFSPSQIASADATLLFDGSDVGFSGANFDISSITLAEGDVPEATNMTQTVAYTEGDVTVELNDIAITDADVGDTVTATLTLADISAGNLSTGTFGASTSTYNAGTGVWTVSGSVSDVNAALAAVAFSPETNYDIDTTISTHIEDGAGLGPADGVITLDVTAENDVPTATNMDQAINYGPGQFTIPLNDIVVTDVDSNEVITATLRVASILDGSLSTGTYGSATSTYNGLSGVWRISGSVADVNAALADVVFQRALSLNGQTTISTQIQDQLGSGPANGTIDIDLSAVNTASTATNLDQTIAYVEDAVSVALDDIVVSDIDVFEVITATLTLTDTAAGSLSSGTFGASTSSYTAGTGVWTVTGTVSDVNDALAAVTFAPAANYDTNTTITSHIEDAAGEGPADGTISLNVTAQNDAPTATNLTQVQAYTEDAATVALDDIVVSDVDTGETVTATLTLIDTSAGSLSTGTFGASTSTYTAGTGVWAITGTVGDVNDALAAIAFVPATDYDTDATIITHIEDAAGAGPADGTISLNVTAVNDAPTLSIPGTAFINELHFDNVGTDTGEAIEIAGVAGTDLSGWSLVLYTGADGTAYDTVSLSGILTDQADGFGTVVVNFPTNGIENALAGSADGLALVDSSGTVRQFLSYGGSFSATDGAVLGLNSTDIGLRENGSTAVGQSLQLTGTGTSFSWSAAANTFGGINAGQDFSALNSLVNQSIDEDLSLIFNAANGNAIVVGDIDAALDGAVDPVSVTLEVSNGALTLGGLAGLGSVSGNTTNLVTLTGTVAELNAALDGLSYQPTANFNGNDTLTITVDDQGNSGAGNTPLAIGTVNINVNPQNDAPTATNLTQTQAYTEDAASVALDDIVITDVDTSDTMTATLTLANTSAGSLSTGTFGASSSTYTAGTGVWTVTGSLTDVNAALAAVAFVPSTDHDTNTTISTHIEDTSGTGPADGSIALNVTAVNDDPIVSNALLNQAATEEVAFSFTLPNDTFEDVDTGAVITYSAQLQGGAALPVWLDFNASTRTFSGTPDNADVGTLVIEVIADDGQGGTPATDTFDIVISNTNDDPTLDQPIPNQTATEDSAFSFTFAANTFSDADVGNTLTYSAQMAGGGVLPSWLNFDAETRTFSGTPANGDVGTVSIEVTADDSQGGTAATDVFNIVVANTNDTPTGSVVISGTPTEDQTLTAGTSAIADDDGLGAFDYQWLRDGVDISGATASTYTLGDADVGTSISVQISYTDARGEAESLTSTDTPAIANVNDAPVGDVSIAGSATLGSTLTASNNLSDDDGLGAISYQWQRNGVDISGAVGSSYTVAIADIANTINVVASYTDANDTVESVTSVTTASITAVNNAPSGNVTIAGSAQEDQVLTADTSGLSDLDGLGSFSYQWQADGTNIAGAVASSYTLDNSEVGKVITVVLNYTDGLGTAESVVSGATAAVTNLNDAPTATNLNQSKTYIEGAASVAIDDIVITDLDAGENVSATLTLSNAAAGALTTGTFGASTSTYNSTTGIWTVSGSVADVNAALSAVSFMPQVNNDLDAFITSHIEDDDGAGPTDGVISLDVSPVNDDPTLDQALPDQVASEDSAFTFTFAANSFSDVDSGDNLIYSALLSSGAPLPAWLSFDAATRTFSGTPANGDIGTLMVEVFADDGQGGSAASDVFNITINNTNDDPTLDQAIPNQVATEDMAFSFTFDVATFDDVDVGDSLSYSATLSDGSVLPAWLSFDASSRTFSGTPANSDVSTLSIEVVADDGNGGVVTDTFEIIVSDNNTAPTGGVQISGNPTVGETLTADTSRLSDADGLGTLSYQWLKNGSVIGGAESSSYVVGSSDVGTSLSVRVSYVDGGGTTETLSSASVFAIDLAPIEPPVIEEETEVVIPPTTPIVPVEEAPEDAEEEEETEEEDAEEQGDVDAAIDPVDTTSRFSGIDADRFENPVDSIDIQDFGRDVSTDSNSAVASVVFDGPKEGTIEEKEAIYKESTSGFSGFEEDPMLLIQTSNFIKGLDSMREEVNQNVSLGKTAVGSSLALSAGVSAGYVAWLARSGVLLSSVMSSLPVWRFVDPLPVLSGGAASPMFKDQESLESMVASDEAGAASGSSEGSSEDASDGHVDDAGLSSEQGGKNNNDV